MSHEQPNNAGMLVTVAYRGFFDDGHTFLEAPREAPIHFPCEPGWMPQPIIDAVTRMRVGEVRTIRVGADEAFEERSDDRIFCVPCDKVPPKVLEEIGKVVNLEGTDGRSIPARLVSIDDDVATFDANHEAICMDLNFEITLLDAKDLGRR